MARPKRYIRAAALILCALLLMTAAGCGGGSDGPVLQEGETFTVAVTDMPDTLNPLTTEGGLSEEFFLLAYDPLWRANAAGEPVNCLVEDYDLSSDQLTWTIRLRHGVTFSNGDKLTSADVKFTYELMMRQSKKYAPYMDGISVIRCPDDYTVVITTSFVKGDMQNNPTPILPRRVWSNLEGDMTDFENLEMVGTGPFVCVPSETNDPQEKSWTFQARADYFAEPAKVGQVKFLYFGTATSAARALGAAEVDAGIGMTDVQLTTLEEVPGVELIQAVLPHAEVWALAFNTRKGFFQEQSMRQMVEHCTDRERILSMSSGRAGMAGSVWASPGADYFYTVPNKRGFDLNAATNLVASLGRYGLNANGNLESLITGEELKLSLYTSSQDEWAATAATILVEDMASIGIQLEWETTDKPVRSVCTPRSDWDMCMVAWNGDSNASMAALPFRTTNDSLTGWSSSVYDQTLGRLQMTMDDGSIRTLAGQLQQVMYDECPYVIIGYCSDIQAVRQDAWTGYEDALAASGGLFNTGSADAYMSITHREGADMPEEDAHAQG